MKKNVWMNLVMMAALLTAVSSCSESEPAPNGSLSLEASANTNTAPDNGRMASGITITDFKVNIKEVEFDFDGKDSVYKDIKLKGPFELDLIKDGTNVVNKIGVSELPNAIYKEIEFKLHKSKVEGAEMFGKSIMISGTIGQLPFVFWHDTDEEFEIQFKDSKGMAIQGEEVKAIIDFNIGYLFSEMSGFDFSAARDKNGDNIIEISPDDVDGNKDLAHALKDALEDITDFIDDRK